ncbi:MAG: MFS transporter [Burkholderiales bacterium]|nr:MFS transporter [Burkholderiales bacterium]
MSHDTPAATGPGFWGGAAPIFLSFAFAYFFSALLRAVTATLAPVFSQELNLSAGALGLLAGAYFLGFSAMQLPLGAALDRRGPKHVLTALMVVAVAGCVAFALANSVPQLLLARLLIGVGVSACLMAPLTCFRHRFDPALQLRMNSWMLMTGSLGMLASTLPVQWLLPIMGWRGLFFLVAALLLVAIVAIARLVPADEPAAPAKRLLPNISTESTAEDGYRAVFTHPAFLRMAPLAFFAYGGLVAMQSLWIGPWLTRVAGQSPAHAAEGLFLVNACMLVAFLVWGLVMPRLTRRGWSAERIIRNSWPVGTLWLGGLLALGQEAGAGAWALWCVLTSVVSLSQPAVGQAFHPALAGRALSAYNLVIFVGVFALQWGIGVLIDLLTHWGWGPLPAFRAAFGLVLVGCLLSFLWLHWSLGQEDGARQSAAARR